MLTNMKYELEEEDDENNEPEEEVGQTKEEVGEEEDIAEKDGQGGQGRWAGR